MWDYCGELYKDRLFAVRSRHICRQKKLAISPSFSSLSLLSSIQFQPPTAMLNPSNPKGKTYADRPATPLGQETGLTSTPVSENPTRGNTPGLNAAPNPYHYQPAITSTRPELTSLRRNSTNYAQAQAESLTKLTTPSSPESEESSPRHASGRSYSFSAEDLKRSQYHYLMTDGGQQDVEVEGDEEGKRKQPLKSPGIGNSEVKGREYGFTTAG